MASHYPLEKASCPSFVSDGYALSGYTKATRQLVKEYVWDWWSR